jgi:uncharacterized protein involved in exopolysaccharide biosynthesis
MQLHDYLRLARRNLALLVLLPLLLGVGAWFYSNSKPKQYSASALVLMHPNDPNEQLNSVGTGQGGARPTPFPGQHSTKSKLPAPSPLPVTPRC